MTGSARRGRLGALLVGVGAAALTVYLLAPVSGIDTLPPVCFAALGYSVPCGAGWAFGAALVVGLLTGWATSQIVTRRASPSSVR